MTIEFLGKEIGYRKYPFIVGEISCNHKGSKVAARLLIEKAKEAFLDAVKIQIYTPEEMTVDVRTPDFMIQDGIWKGRYLYELYTKTQTNFDMAQFMFEEAKKVDIPIFASVFGKKSLEYAEQLGCPAYKVASFEITDYVLIEDICKTDKPIVFSSGLSNIHEINDAFTKAHSRENIVLHCVSAYPTPNNEANLNRMAELSLRFRYVGFSDHTRGIEAGPLAAARGACMLEKHLQLRGDFTEDAAFSLYPDEMQQYVIRCRRAFEAVYGVNGVAGSPSEEASQQMRRSLYIVTDVKQGEVVTHSNVRAIRPGYGEKPYKISFYLGMKFNQDYPAGTPLNEDRVSD